MSTGYTRQSAAEIIPSAVVKSSSFNNELNKIRDAFKFSTDGSTGHTHDGSSDEGSYIPLIADVDANNKLVVDGSTNRISFYSEVSSSPIEQVRFEDGVIYPVTDNDVDLGTSSLKFKDIYTKTITVQNGFSTPVNAGDPVTLEYFDDTISGTSPSLKPLLWLSGGTYEIDEVRTSTVNYLPYKALTNHTGLSTDPSLDGTNWVSVNLSTQVQAEAGTDNATLMTPLRTKQAIDTLAPFAMTHLETITLGSAVAAVEIVIPSGYHSIEIYFSNLRSSGATAGLINLRTSSDGGSSYISTNTYHRGLAGTRTLQNALGVTTTYSAGSTTGKLSFSFLEAGFRTMFGVDCFTEDNSTVSISSTFITMRSVADLTDAVQIYLSAGNIESGAKFEVYGIKAGA